VDAVARAYAVLGLAQGARLPDVRRRYVLLAKRWHPDRFASDAVGRRTAEAQMRIFNQAYRTLVEALGRRASPVQTRQPGRRLSREEIERMVAAMSAPGPIDTLLTTMGWVGSRLEALWAGVFLVVGVVRVAYLLATGRIGQLIQDLKAVPDLVLAFVVLAAIGIAEGVRRRRLRKEEASILAQARGSLTSGSS
jgi:hypothetical protein